MTQKPRKRSWIYMPLISCWWAHHYINELTEWTYKKKTAVKTIGKCFFQNKAKPIKSQLRLYHQPLSLVLSLKKRRMRSVFNWSTAIYATRCNWRKSVCNNKINVRLRNGCFVLNSKKCFALRITAQVVKNSDDRNGDSGILFFQELERKIILFNYL